jgi:hypothetical protein
MEQEHSNFKAGFQRGLGFVAAAVAIPLTVLLAQSIHTFSPGQTVSASQMNANFQIAAPTGAIMGFYLSACPSGWIAADGTNGTPDLRGAFVRARDPGNATGRDPDGDRASGAYQVDAFGSHNHGVQSAPPVGGGASGITFAHQSNPITQSGIPTTNSAGGSETRPKNVALTFCMRKDT